jgi:predicted nucleotidyltransferase
MPSSVLNQLVLDALLAEARGDDNVVGIVVFGSRGKGAFVTEASD